MAEVTDGHPSAPDAPQRRHLWFEEELEEDLRWVFGVSRGNYGSILHSGVSKFQDIELVESIPFGKVLILDGKLQSAERDEFVYHETLVHPPLLHHPNPKRVFIMGGGEGSTAREALRHRSVDTVVMCDIDEEVVDFCREHLLVNRTAFSSNRLELIINDARAELLKEQEGYDIIVGDLADPVDGGPCYMLYTESFYLNVIKPRLKPGGILVTQASDEPLPKMAAEEANVRINERLSGDLRFLDGDGLVSLINLNKYTRNLLEAETTVYTEDSPLFIHGHGTQHLHSA